MTKTPLKVSHCVCDCPAKPSGRQLQQHNKWSVRDYPGTISGLLRETLTKQACRAPFFFCPGAIWVTHWSDWTTTIKASGFPQFSPQGSAWAKTDVKNRAHVFVISLWKWERTISPSTFGYRKQYENTWRNNLHPVQDARKGGDWISPLMLARPSSRRSFAWWARMCVFR